MVELRDECHHHLGEIDTAVMSMLGTIEQDIAVAGAALLGNDDKTAETVAPTSR